MQKKFYLLYYKLKATDWKHGGGTVMYYIALMWLLVLATILFVEYYNVFSHVGKTQLYADIVADGSAFIGNNGWGLDTKKANNAKDILEKINMDNYEDTEIDINFRHTDSKGVEKKASKKDGYNTVTATAILDTQEITTDTDIFAVKEASTHITYSGGLKIVLEAWKHSYQYRNSSKGQTAYVWGGGHGIASDSNAWETYADCSGFVSGVFRKCGYDIPSWTCTWNLETMGQLVGNGYSALEDARPGDIILYWYGQSSTSGHVGIYAGKFNGKHYQVHCSGGQRFTYTNPGRGNSSGAQLAGITAANKIMIRRIVDSDAKAYETPEVKIAGLSSNQTEIYLTLSSMGFKDATIAGMMGNWACEGNSSPIVREGHINENDLFNTSYAKKIENKEISKTAFVYEGKGKYHYGSEGYGIAQWTTTNWGNPYADRKAALWDYTNGNVTSLTMQIGFVVHELQTGIWQNPRENAPSQYLNATYEQFISCDDPGEAAKMFLVHYEGIWDGTEDKRADKAREIYRSIRKYNR